jgi:hypothetical protein
MRWRSRPPPLDATCSCRSPSSPTVRQLPKRRAYSTRSSSCNARDRGRTATRSSRCGARPTSYVWTLFLDTDTFVGAPLDDCWDLLAHFDLVAASDRGYVDDFPPGTGVPTSFKEPNLGVVFYRRSPLIEHMLDQALAYYDELATPRDGGAPISQYDQPAIRLALYRSALRLGTLSEEDNCRFANYGKLNGPVRVLHGRLPRAAHTPANLQRVMDRLNATTVPRVFVAGRAWALWPHRLPYTHNYRAMRLRRFNVIEMRPVLAAVRAQARRVVRRVLRF